MKLRLPLSLLVVLACSSSSISFAASHSAIIDLLDTEYTVDSIIDLYNEPDVKFSVINSTLNVTGNKDPNDGIVLNDRKAVVTGSTLNVVCAVELHQGTYDFTNSILNFGRYNQNSGGGGLSGGTATFTDSTLNISSELAVNDGSTMILSGKTHAIVGGSLDLRSSKTAASSLTLDGKEVALDVGSININNSVTARAIFNIKGSSLNVQRSSSFDYVDLAVTDEGKITADSFRLGSSGTLSLTENTSVTTKNSLNISGGVTANGASLTSEEGTLYLSLDKSSLQETNLTGKEIKLSSYKAVELSSVHMRTTGDGFKLISPGSVTLAGTSTAQFDRTTLYDRSTLIIKNGAEVSLGDLFVGGGLDEYFGYEEYQKGNLVIEGNTTVRSGNTNIILAGSSMDIKAGGTITMGTGVNSVSGNYSLIVQEGASLTVNQGAVLSTDRAVYVANGATLWSGDTTGLEVLTTTTGITGGEVLVQDGATLGTYVHDTGETTKTEIIDSMKAGFKTGDGVHYLYQIGQNVTIADLSVAANETIITGDGSSVTIGEITQGGSVEVNGGTVNIASAGADAGKLVTIGSFNESPSESSAHVKMNASPYLKPVIIAAADGTGAFQAAVGETTVVGRTTSVEATTLVVKESGTTLVNKGKINAKVVAESGTIVKGTGSFNKGLTMNVGSVFVVGNSPGQSILNGTVSMAADAVVFSLDGTKVSTSSTKGWGSKSYSNILVQSGSFAWDGNTQLTLEMAASFVPTEDSPISFDLMKFVVINKDQSEGVSSIVFGDTDLLTTGSNSGAINGINIDFSDAKSVDGVELAKNMRDMKLSYFITDNTATGGEKYVTLRLSAMGGSPAIPEPSTVSLSLLALAGLMLRRRR